MAICVPIEELKNPGEFMETVIGSRSPVVATKDGKEAFVAMPMREYEALDRLERNAGKRLFQRRRCIDALDFLGMK